MFLSLSVSRNLHVFTSHVRSSEEDSKAGVCVQEENKDKAAKATHTNKKGEGWEIRHVTPRDVSLDGGVTLEEERDSCGWSPTSRAPAAFPPRRGFEDVPLLLLSSHGTWLDGGEGCQKKSIFCARCETLSLPLDVASWV